MKNDDNPKSEAPWPDTRAELLVRRLEKPVAGVRAERRRRGQLPKKEPHPIAVRFSDDVQLAIRARVLTGDRSATSVIRELVDLGLTLKPVGREERSIADEMETTINKFRIGRGMGPLE